MSTTTASTNGTGRYQHEKVRVAIIGVGNCASSFVQGVHYYRDADSAEPVPGLMHVDLGGYHVSDIEFSAAFDIDSEKVGKDLSESIFAGQNNTVKFDIDVPRLGVEVMRGMTHDGLGKYLSQKITKAPGPTVDIVEVLKETRTDVVVSYLPVGSEQATKWYVEQILEAGCGFVNCIPVFIAREGYWNSRFKKAGLPIVGDDIKSQVGATIIHRQLARLFHDRGVKLLRTSQLNVGGNMDFFNMLERERLESKKISKTNAVTSIMGHELPADDVHVGPSDYVPWLTDRKWAHIRLEGQAFGDVPLTAELKLEVWDSPNSAGIVTDAVRCCKLALNNGLAGQLDGPSSYLMKSPMHQRPDGEARDLTEAFIKQYSRKPITGAVAGDAPAATDALAVTNQPRT
ncbi:MAG TPA: inositol-3-phosphate synthase [Solirubrobacteraceae bacterium]|nr:inositol-3-phosphate synthase [Solirubrobacteraceae bacterium]